MTERGDQARVGIFGGSGFYEFLTDAEQIEVATPYGPAAAPVTLGAIAGHPVAFMPRHGPHHSFAAHRVPYRANAWALHSVGVRSIIAPCSAGSLQTDIHPGQLVVVDQLVDRTRGRADTYFDLGAAGTDDEFGRLHHQSFADPYDAEIRRALLECGRHGGADMVDGGTMVVINGPRFSTRAESRWFRSMGWHVVNMTGYPESVLAAELGVRYAAVALVTDYDAGVDGQVPVTMDRVFEVMRSNVALVAGVITSTIESQFDALTQVGIDRT